MKRRPGKARTTFPLTGIPPSLQLDDDALSAVSSTRKIEGIQWYREWILPRLQKLERSMQGVRPVGSKQTSADLLSYIAKTLRQEGTVGIDSLVVKCEDAGLYTTAIANQSAQHKAIKRNLVFAVLGYVTFLYEPSTSKMDSALFEIDRASVGDQHTVFAQDHSTASRRLTTFLKGFGTLIPRKSVTPVAKLAQDASEELPKTHISSAELNVELLVSVAGFTIEWTDVLGSHLYLDEHRQVLYLFRYPVICMRNSEWSSDDSNSQSGKPILYACASSRTEEDWTMVSEIQNLLAEVPLTLRLLFGQHKKSRDRFKSLDPSEDSFHSVDPQLAAICTSNSYDLPVYGNDRDLYQIRSMLPFFERRLLILASWLKAKRSRTWRELWRDRRDSAQWWTFWTVLVFGSLGICLNVLGVVLQAVQVWKAF